MSRMYNPPHPGHQIKEALEHLNMTVGQFAKHLGVTRATISRIINEKAGITPVMSIKLAQAFRQPSLDIWFKMQADYDFWHAEQRAKKRASIKSLVKPALKKAA